VGVRDWISYIVVSQSEEGKEGDREREQSRLGGCLRMNDERENFVNEYIQPWAAFSFFVFTSGH